MILAPLSRVQHKLATGDYVTCSLNMANRLNVYVSEIKLEKIKEGY